MSDRSDDPGRRSRRPDREECGPGPDDRPPICPACGVTMGFVVVRGGVRHVCLECGYSDEG